MNLLPNLPLYPPVVGYTDNHQRKKMKGENPAVKLCLEHLPSFSAFGSMLMRMYTLYYKPLIFMLKQPRTSLTRTCQFIQEWQKEIMTSSLYIENGCAKAGRSLGGGYYNPDHYFLRWPCPGRLSCSQLHTEKQEAPPGLLSSCLCWDLQ